MSEGAPRVIKRYANRKLYDTSSGTFTTVGEVASLVMDGVNVVVRDHDTGADRTGEVLAKAIGRSARANPIGIGADILSGILRAPRSEASDSSATPEEPDSTAELEELRRQVAELNAAVKALRAETPGEDDTSL